MQPHVNPGSSEPGANPSLESAGPRPVAPSHDGAPRPTSQWWVLVVVVAIAAAGYWLWQKQQQVDRRLLEAKVGIRTTTIQKGSVERTLRLSGVTAAERFETMIAPQIRGSRSGRNRNGLNLAGMDATSVSALPALGGGGGAASAGGSAAVAGASGSVASTGGTASRTFGGSGATRAASSRIASPNPSPRSTSSGATAGSSSALGGDGLGSTSSQLGSGLGAPGGGGGDFTLVLQHLVKPGSMVKKGDVVAEFDRQFMLQRLDDYKSTMETARAQLAQQRANLDLARYTYKQNVEKAKAALEKARLDTRTLPVLSAIDAERVKLALEEAEAQYQQQLAQAKFMEQQERAQLRYAELEFKSLEIEYRRAEANADRMLARASLDGMTVMQNIWRGGEMAQIQQGDQIYPGQFFMQVVDPNSMVINASVNQVDGEKVRIGMKARIRFDAYPGLEVPAHVVNVAAVPRSGGMRASFVREIPVRLKIDRMDPRIIPDLSCSVDVVLDEQHDTTVAPLSGLFSDPSTGKQVVYIKQGEAWIRRQVETGLGNHLVVTVKGLNPGEVIALDPPPSVGAEPNKG